jgi:hypothetical protein
MVRIWQAGCVLLLLLLPEFARAGRNRDGRVTVKELRDYLRRCIARIKGAQHPVIRDYPRIHRVRLTRLR